MLTRQKTLLCLLKQAGKPLLEDVVMKLAFLLRQETALINVPSFYDFVPFRSGPFSFSLAWEIGRLQRNGHLTTVPANGALSPTTRSRGLAETKRLAAPARAAVTELVRRYGRMSASDLASYVCRKYPRFTLNGNHAAAIQRAGKAPVAVYTAGYEGKSVDRFLGGLLDRGVSVLIDVRANPVSRKFGFAGKRTSQLCSKLGLKYHHAPNLGIPSDARHDLGSFTSYQHLLGTYERRLLSRHQAEVDAVARLMCQQPSVLMCFENDVRCCHRSKLADAIARSSTLEVIHL